MSSQQPGRLVDPFLRLARAGKTAEAKRLALGLLDDGVPPEGVIVDLLVPVQRMIGELWQRNECSVVDEHIVTAVTQSTLGTLSDAVTMPDPTGMVVIASAEGDWHSLPSQMFAELLRAAGVGVSYLGGSTPVDHLAEFLRWRPPDALVVSCSLAMFYTGVTRLADAAHQSGVPVLAGGRALGATATRSARLGADCWVPDAATLVSLLAAGPITLAPAAPPPDPVALELEAQTERIAAEAYERLLGVYPSMLAYDARQLARTREDLSYITRFVAAAKLADDPTVLREFLEWTTDVLGRRYVPAEALTAGIDALLPLLDALDPTLSALFATA